jgi:integrase
MNDPAERPRRAYGSGSLLIHTAADGTETWHRRWYAGGRRLKRRLGPKRRRGIGKGLTRTQAEAELRRLMARHRRPPPRASVPFGVAAEQMLAHLEAVGRKASTLGNYRTILRAHLLPRFGEIDVERLRPDQVEAFAAELRHAGKAARSRANTLKLLSQILAYAQRNGWCEENVCAQVARPRVRQSSDIRFLDREELEALLAAVDVSARPFGRTDHAILLTAAMTGLRQGELLALRWRDVDWRAKRIRVRRNYVRGHWDTPKSRSGERSVPLATRVAEELRRHRERSSFPADGDLVFAHPETGDVLPHSPPAPALQEHPEGRRRPRHPLPRPSPYLRHEDGRLAQRLDARSPGVAGPPRLQDDADLCRLRTPRGGEQLGRRRLLLMNGLIHRRSAEFADRET